MAQVQGEEIYLSHSGQEVDDNIDEVVAARGSEASLSARLADIVSDFEADQQRQETEIGAVAVQGAKNLLKITASSQTIKGVTFTVNDDQTVTVNGTNDGTGASTFVIVPNAQAITIPDGNYILSGCPTGGGESAPFDLRWYMYSPGKSAYDSGNGASIEKSGNGTGSNIAIVVKTGQTAHNITFKPMIRRAEITDSTYVPYAPTNRELYETKAKQTETNVIANLGAKNLFRNDKNAGATVVKQGATWVFDQTSVVANVSGTVSTVWSDVFLLNSNFDLSDKEYKIVIESDSPDVFVYIPGNTLSGGNIPSNGQYFAGVYRYQGIMTTSTRFTAKTGSYSNATIRCMICPAEITDDTFQPYAPTNRELYEMILALQSGRSLQSVSPASLMQAGRLDAELTAAEPEEEADE